ncbi:hypothetical protein AK812_SmicGene45500 [Symbiodinium microadriaticum]|uniref:Uncharacterized protein n=1 Tax=Symbiodinium microadriaticum TaxID=2951 RepID=A0A1Q9BVX0_SYMMI|nr:hypothetical protein AK812_SmicGene45500 [Symbiodinium microadriaticum]
MNSSCADIAVDLCSGGGRVFLLLLLDAEGGAERKWFSGHPGRYDLLLEEVLILGDYDAVVCMDDDIFITNPRRTAARVESSPQDSEKLVVASLDEQVNGRVPFNTGVRA